jgi:hypothetical protein
MRRSPPRCASLRLAQSGFGAEPATSFRMQRLTGCFHYPATGPEFLVLVLGSSMTEKARAKRSLAHALVQGSHDPGKAETRGPNF